MTAQQIAEQLDYYGSYFDVNIDRDYAYISFCHPLQILRTDARRGRSRCCLHPTFPEEELRTYCAKRKQRLAHRAHESRTSRPAKPSPGRCSVPHTPTAFRADETRLRPTSRATTWPISTHATTPPRNGFVVCSGRIGEHERRSRGRPRGAAARGGGRNRRRRFRRP